jgi:hypothetical protein
VSTGAVSLDPLAIPPSRKEHRRVTLESQP